MSSQSLESSWLPLALPAPPVGPPPELSGIRSSRQWRLKWTSQEDAKLLELTTGKQGREGLTWREVSQHLPGRTRISCLNRYSRYINGGKDRYRERKKVEAAAATLVGFRNHTSSLPDKGDPPSTLGNGQKGRKREVWGAEDDAKILEPIQQREKGYLTWTEVSQTIPGHSAGGCETQCHRLVVKDLEEREDKEREDIVAALALIRIRRSAHNQPEQIYSLPTPTSSIPTEDSLL